MTKKKEDVVVLQRLQPTPYTVNYTESNGKITHYRWLGATDRRESKLEVPREVYDYLVTSTYAFQKGRLVVADDDTKEELNYEIGDELPNVLSIEELKAILALKGTEFKKALETMDKVNLNALADIAIETKEDSSTKKRAIAKALGVDEDLLFGED